MRQEEELTAGHRSYCNCNFCKARYDKIHDRVYTAYLRVDIMAPTEESARYKVKYGFDGAELVGIHGPREK